MSLTRILLGNDIKARELKELAANPGLMIDITGLEPGRLPPVVKAHIWSYAGEFLEPNLKRAEGNIIAPAAKRADFSALEEVWGLASFQSLKRYSAPRQIRAGDISIRDAHSLDVPALEVIGNLAASGLQKCHAPKLSLNQQNTLLVSPAIVQKLEKQTMRLVAQSLTQRVELPPLKKGTIRVELVRPRDPKADLGVIMTFR